MHHSEAHFQTSETFLLSAVLALSGGFQDAYTYNVRDEVFSNAQTGNIVLMSQHLMEGDWMTALHYLFPLLAFALGVFVAEQIGHRYKTSTRLHWRTGCRRHRICFAPACRLHSHTVQHHCNRSGILRLLHAGADFP